MRLGIALFVLASVAYPLVDPRLLLVIRFLQGLGAAALSAVSLALVGTYAVAHRGRAYGVYNAIKGASYVISPLIGGAIVWQSSFAGIFLATAGVGTLAFALSLLLPKPASTPGDVFDDDDLSFTGLLAVFRQPTLWPWYIVTVVNMFFVGIPFGFLPVRVHALGYDALGAGLLLSTVTASYLLVQPVAGILGQRASSCSRG